MSHRVRRPVRVPRQGSPAGPEVSRKGADRVKRRQARASPNPLLLALSSRPRLPPYLPFVASSAWTAQTQRVASSSKSPRGLTIPAIFRGFRLSLGQPSRTSTVVVCCFVQVCAVWDARCNLAGEIISPSRSLLADETHRYLLYPIAALQFIIRSSYLYQQLQPRSRGLVRPLHPPPQPKGVVLTDGAHRVSILTGLEPVILKPKINN